jgi:lipoate---protein ligase
MKCRLMDTGEHSAYWNMGLDESILRHISEGKSPPTIRFYKWKPPAVSVGYFQSLREEVDIDACFNDGVGIVRRMTGGGAVYHDKELTYSYIAPESTVPDGILQSYELVCSGIVMGLGHLGVRAKFAPLNDILVGGKKVSGNAQTRRMNCVLQHGTVLLDVDVERMFRYLRVPQEKAKDKAIANVKERVTSLKAVLRTEVTYHMAAEALRRGFSEALDLKLTESPPSVSEAEAAARLEGEKYSALEWNDKR